MIWESVARFITSLGASLVLSTLRMSVELTEEQREYLIPVPGNCHAHLLVYLGVLIALDISNLTNLKCFTVDCLRKHLYRDAGMVQYLCQLFAQLNIPLLEEATVRLVRLKSLGYVKELDKFLTGEKFRDLKRFNVSIAPFSTEVQDWDTVETARSLFPNMEARGILRVVELPPPLCMP